VTRKLLSPGAERRKGRGEGTRLPVCEVTVRARRMEIGGVILICGKENSRRRSCKKVGEEVYITPVQGGTATGSGLRTGRGGEGE